jgi:acyl carrier protein
MPDDDPVLRETLKRCSPATYYAACKFRASGGAEHLHAVLLGVIERFVERDLRVKLQGPAETLPALRLRQDLGLDSLTMMEIVMIAEEVLPITISNEELTRLTTLGQVQHFVEGKLTEPRALSRPTVSRQDDWNVAAVGEQLRHLEVHSSPALDRLPEQRPNHA